MFDCYMFDRTIYLARYLISGDTSFSNIDGSEFSDYRKNYLHKRVKLVKNRCLLLSVSNIRRLSALCYSYVIKFYG